MIIMPTLTITTEQIIDLIQQLPLKEKRIILLELVKETETQRQERLDYGESQLRRLCNERGINWNTLSDEEREDFINDLIHEDRPCIQ
jgi:TRAP-type C4-dicarboxylate transport system substrate-binding protein